jgi:hypothetical protein
LLGWIPVLPRSGIVGLYDNFIYLFLGNMGLYFNKQLIGFGKPFFLGQWDLIQVCSSKSKFEIQDGRHSRNGESNKSMTCHV